MFWFLGWLAITALIVWVAVELQRRGWKRQAVRDYARPGRYAYVRYSTVAHHFRWAVYVDRPWPHGILVGMFSNKTDAEDVAKRIAADD